MDKVKTKRKMIKICTKCGSGYPATTEYFYADRTHKDGLHSECKKCHKQVQKKRYQKARNLFLQRVKRYQSTIIGHLRHVFNDMKRRCSDSKCSCYKYYGGRGIRLEFTFDELYNWCTKNSIDPRGLEIDRIDNNGNYNLDNIQFVTHKENCNNRRKYVR